MPTTDNRFRDYLVRQGILAPEDAKQVFADVRPKPMMLGRILLTDQIMTVKQVMKVLEVQLIDSTMRFGEIAVREGLLTEEQLNKALAKQARQSYHPIKALYNANRFEVAELVELVVGYVKTIERLVVPAQGQNQ